MCEVIRSFMSKLFDLPFFGWSKVFGDWEDIQGGDLDLDLALNLFSAVLLRLLIQQSLSCSFDRVFKYSRVLVSTGLVPNSSFDTFFWSYRCGSGFSLSSYLVQSEFLGNFYVSFINDFMYDYLLSNSWKLIQALLKSSTMLTFLFLFSKK